MKINLFACTYMYITFVHQQIIKQDRFSLLKFLHLNDNSKYVKKGQPGHDPLFKVRPFLDPLIHNFQDAYHPSRELSIDESMIGFKGRLSFIQYLPKKPTKAFVLADSKNGYTCNWRLYTGMYYDIAYFIARVPMLLFPMDSINKCHYICM